MHDIEYKAAKLEAQKLQMANESRKAYDDYLVALDATKIQMKTINTDGSLNYVDATYNRLMDAGYKLSSAGRIIVSQADIDYFNNMAHGNALEFACLKSGFAVKDGSYTVLASNHDIGLAFNETGLKQLVTGGKNIALMDDITVNSSLGSYSKTLDGNGKTLTVNGYSGAFSSINNATIRNLNINSNITCTYGKVGALANTSSGTNTIENISLSGNIIAKSSVSYVGGLIGYLNNGKNTISNISMDISIDGTTGCIGGLIGANNYSDLSVSGVSGNFRSNSTTNDQIGGIIGNTWLDSSSSVVVNVRNCKINASITGDNSQTSGGIFGMNWDSSKIENCYVSGSIRAYGTGTGGAGGICGGWGPNPTKSNGTGEIINCYSDAIIQDVNPSAVNSKRGDLVGLTWATVGAQTEITNCASNNGTDQSTLIGATYNLTFTQATDANAVKSAVLAATANAGASLSTPYSPPSTSAYSNFYEIGLAIQEDRVLSVDGMENNTEWLTNMINEGEILLQKPNKDGTYYDISVATDTGLQEVSDEKDLRKAEAKYEADMKKIDMKDRRYDTELAALDNERNAIKSEMETLKTVAKDNVERTFKLFS